MAEEVFADMAKNIDAFKGLNYDDVGDSGVKLNYQFTEQKVKA